MESTSVSKTYLDKLQLLHRHDEMKNNFCKENNKINLFRISYKNQEHINTILNGLFNEKRSETIEKFKLYAIIDGNIIENNYYDEYNINLLEYTQASGSGENKKELSY